jgi:hypothetical protein
MTFDDQKPKAIRQRADECRDRIFEIEAELAKAITAEERGRLEERIGMMRELEDWFRGRPNYK